jgi:hypothetical protein
MVKPRPYPTITTRHAITSMHRHTHKRKATGSHTTSAISRYKWGPERMHASASNHIHKRARKPHKRRAEYSTPRDDSSITATYGTGASIRTVGRVGEGGAGGKRGEKQRRSEDEAMRCHSDPWHARALNLLRGSSRNPGMNCATPSANWSRKFFGKLQKLPRGRAPRRSPLPARSRSDQGLRPRIRGERSGSGAGGAMRKCGFAHWMVRGLGFRGDGIGIRREKAGTLGNYAGVPGVHGQVSCHANAVYPWRLVQWIFFILVQIENAEYIIGMS